MNTFEDLRQAIEFFEAVPTRYQADVVQIIGLELFVRGELEGWEFRLLCTNLF